MTITVRLARQDASDQNDDENKDDSNRDTDDYSKLKEIRDLPETMELEGGRWGRVHCYEKGLPAQRS